MNIVRILCAVLCMMVLTGSAPKGEVSAEHDVVQQDTAHSAVESSAGRKKNIEALKTSTITSEGRALRSVESFDDAKQFVERYCPTVTVRQVSGTKSYYNPFGTTIHLSEDISPDWFGFIFAHELAHHYQHAAHYQHQPLSWIPDLQDGSAEIQADHMAFLLYHEEKPHYTDQRATGMEAIDAADMIHRGRMDGC